MGTLGEIKAAINLIEEKKENLRKSFEDLESQSSSSLNFTLKWTDFDSYFTTLRSSLQHKLHLLQTLYPSSDMTSVLASPEVKSFCQNSDGLGLRRFIIIAPDRLSVRAELPDAYRCAPDAAAMVLDAMDGFYRGKGTELRLVKSGCVIMLEGLMLLKPDVTVELREKAMKMAMQWNQKRVSCHVREKEVNAFGFLLLVGAYGLIDGFSMDELIDCFVIVARRRQTIDLCRKMIPANKINDLIQKLIDKDMQIAAVKFSIEFQKTDEFPPVRLLEEHKLMSKRIAEEMRKNGKDHRACNEARAKEVNTLKSIIKCIDDYHLESEYPKDAMVALVKKLEKKMESRKRPARAFLPKKQQLSKPKKPMKRSFVEAAASAVATTVQNVIPLQQSHLQGSGLLPDHVAHSTPTAPYAGLTGANIGYGGNPMPAGSSFYVTESQPPSGYYNRPASNSNGGYELPPEYHPSMMFRG